MKVLKYTLLIFIVDQVTKFLVKGFHLPYLKMKFSGLSAHKTIEIIDGWFFLTKVENYGIAFGIDFGKNFRIILMLFSFLVIIILFLYLLSLKNKSILHRLGVAFILGGACGNLFDRVFYGIIFGYAPLFQGRVIDFIQISIFELSFLGRSFNSLPVFNIADVAILAGVVLIIIAVWRDVKEVKNADEINQEF